MQKSLKMKTFDSNSLAEQIHESIEDEGGSLDQKYIRIYCPNQ